MAKVAYRLLSRKKRGIVLTTELILLLTAVIAIVAVAAYGLGKTVLSQATSSKTSLVVEQANAWLLGFNQIPYSNDYNYIIAVSMYVQNVGNTPVTLRVFGVVASGSIGTAPANYIQIQPGETEEVSFVVSIITSNWIGPGQNAFVYVVTTTGTEVGTATTLQNPGGSLYIWTGNGGG